MCQCFQIGGPFIAEDPDCPAHGTYAQSVRRRNESALARAIDDLRSLQQRCGEGVHLGAIDTGIEQVIATLNQCDFG